MATILRDWCYRYQWLFDLIVGDVAGGSESEWLQLQDLRNCHNRPLVRDATSPIATRKYSRSVTHPT